MESLSKQGKSDSDGSKKVAERKHDLVQVVQVCRL